MQQSASASSPFSAYSDRAQLGLDVEFGSDPASGHIFPSDCKHADLKQMLDSNKDGLKLEAMKRIIGMIARGRDASELFPSVVKNVVSKNIEVKKLVYVYLVRYAEDQQDLALLSISTFQRALKDPNQLIRASALRVLSSIRVSMIVPIVMLAIRESASDMSPYVRKTAAHAIPKLYSLDAEQKDELVMVIEKLLSDRTTLVVGSAVMAFDEVCPERVDLIHKNYRKLCNLLVDVDEWGQVVIINMLTRYARTQFVNPNGHESGEYAADGHPSSFYEDDANSSYDSSENEHTTKKSRKRKSKRHSSPFASSTCHVDLDHRLLLRQTKPLLQSRNASVVMAVAQLYHHVAPRQEVQIIVKALIRLLRSHKEVQSVVLTCIASMSAKRKAILEPHMKSFFVRTSDPTHIKLLKLDILTNLATAASISIILREFQTYISSSDRSFVAATIQAIGRCAASIKEVTETCLSGLVHLLSNRDEYVVAESVVVIKKLLQTKAAEHYEIISQMAKLLDFIMVPAARAAIIWLIGEYNEKVPKIAPDVLRKMAKTFVDEENNVKLQILNLSVKLYLTNSQQSSMLCQYVFNLARYDPNYDIRDRARFLRQFIFPASGTETILSKQAARIFLAAKPAPLLESKYRDRDHFQLGSLSHYLSQRVTGYNDLPSFPQVAPDPTVRNVDGVDGSTQEMPTAATSPQKHPSNEAHKNTVKKDKNLLSGSEKSSEYSNSGTSESFDSSSDSDESSSEIEEETHRKSQPTQNMANHMTKLNTTLNETAINASSAADSGTEDSESSSGESSDSDSGSGSDSSQTNSNNNSRSRLNTTSNQLNTNENQQHKNSNTKKGNKAATEEAEIPERKSNLDLLLDLDDIPPVGPVMTPSLGGFLTPGTPFGAGGVGGLLPQLAANAIELAAPSYIEFNYKELLNKLSGHGLQLNYRFTRSPHLFSAAMVSIELQFNNFFNDDINNIQVGPRSLPAGVHVNECAPIASLQPLQTTTSVMGVDFNDSTHSIEFEVTSSVVNARISLKPPIGELVRSVRITERFFMEERTKLRGMNEHQSSLSLRKTDVPLQSLKQKVFECINVAHITAATNDVLYFVGQTMSSKSLVLITLDGCEEKADKEKTLLLTVNCEKMVVGSMILNELRNALNAAFKC